MRATEAQIKAATLAMLTEQMRKVLIAAGMEYEDAHIPFLERYAKLAIEAAMNES